MIIKNDIKFIRSLHQKKFRDAHQKFIVEGPKMVKELIANNIPFDTVYFTENELNHENSPKVVKIKRTEMERISALKTPSSMLAVLPFLGQKALPDVNRVLCVGLDKIQDPGNLGSIIRTCDWYGVNDIICSLDTVEKYNPKVIQSSMGGIFRVNVHYRSLPEYCKELTSNKISVVGASLSGSPLKSQKALENGLLVLGNESRGISSDVLSLCSKEITIERKGKAESLNASVACGILLNWTKMD